MDIAISLNKIPIRLTDERWYHISTGHPEVSDYYYEILEAIESPSIIYKGRDRDLIAVKNIDFEDISEKFIVVVYKELNITDGFIITAFISNKTNYLDKKEIVWKKQ